MKKLMIAAAVAAMAGVTLADESYDGGACGEEACKTAYSVAVTVKTTVPKYTTTKDECDECAVGDCSYYLVQATEKLAGYTYGDGTCDDCTLALGDNLILWSTTDKSAVENPVLALFVGQFNKDGKKVEAYGTLSFSDSVLNLAGFGAMAVKCGKNTACTIGTSTGYIKNIAGNVAGYIERDIDPSCDEVFTGCCDEGETAYAAASGTWKISYNASVAKKLAKGYSIEAAVKIPAYVDAEDDAGDVVIEE